MQVASLDLCKQLFELSGWELEVDNFYYDSDTTDDFISEFLSDVPFIAPAYTAGYLLRKLPPYRTPSGKHSRSQALTLNVNGMGTWAIRYPGLEACFADTPEDCAAKLAIELWKQGVLGK